MGGKSTGKNGGGAGTEADSAGAHTTETGRSDTARVNSGADSAGSASAPAAPGVEPLGLVGSTDGLIAEAEAAAASSPAVDPVTGLAGGAPPELNPNGQWSALTQPAVAVLCGVVLPAWEIEADQQKQIAEPLAECLEQLFPGGVDGRYACWVRLIVASGAITVGVAARNGGKLPPLFARKGRSAATNGAAPPPRDPMTLTSLTE